MLKKAAQQGPSNFLYLSIGDWPRLPFTARTERYRCSLQACSFSLEGWGLIDLPLRASNEGWFVWSISSIWFVWLVGPEILHPEEPDRLERPANQTDEPGRVARARGSSQLPRSLFQQTANQRIKFFLPVPILTSSLIYGDYDDADTMPPESSRRLPSQYPKRYRKRRRGLTRPLARRLQNA